MSVNSIFRRITGNRFVMLGCILTAIGTIFFIASAFTRPSKNDLLAKRVNLTIREIGHNLLLQAGDSTSRVLPVMEMSPGIFSLRFEHEFMFKPDSLVALTQRYLAKTNLSDYTVTVYECMKPDIIYGFQISPPSNDIKACNGRIQPKGCYNIQIAFANYNDTKIDYSSASLVVSGLLFILSVTLVASRFAKAEKHAKEPQPSLKTEIINTGLPTLGKFSFDILNQRLLLETEVIDLTDKECKILQLLHRNSGQLTSRDTLIQEIWINEGVITGRSLDMFVSKLRKKLSGDSEVQIINVHGKGYKLMC